MVRDFLNNVKMYYSYARFGFVMLVFITAISGVVELLGIGMIFPLINHSFGNEASDPFSLLVGGALASLGMDNSLPVILLCIVVLFGVKGGLVYVQKYSAWYITAVIRQKIQVRLLDLSACVNYKTFSKLSSGRVSNLIVKETSNFASSFTEFSRILVSVCYLFYYVMTSVVLQPGLAMILMIVGLCIHLSLKGISKKSRVISSAVTEGYGDLSSSIIRVFQNFVYLKSTGAYSSGTKDVFYKINEMRKKELRLMHYASLLSALTEPLSVFALCGLVFFQVHIQNDNITEIVVIGLLLYRALNQLMLVQGQWQRYNSLAGSVRIIQDTLQSFQANQEKSGKIFIKKIRFPISLDDVCFSHGDVDVIRNVSLNLEEGTTVGIVGRSGSGKSTLFHLITGLLKPESGRIIVGDLSFSEIDLESFHSKIGYVAQAPAIFEGTIRSNLLLGAADGNYTESEIIAALNDAACPELTNRLDMEVGEDGIGLSGGQRQRIAIARELLKKSELLIFDEATSALDPETDKSVRDTILSLKGKCTILIISHKISAVEDCDVVYVIENGEIRESGKPKCLLLKTGSLFQNMQN